MVRERRKVTRKLIRFTSVLLLALVLFLAFVAGWLWWRLSSGPLSLSFLDERVEQAINANLKGSGLKVRMDGIILELDEVTGQPAFRLHNLRLLDDGGRMLAHAPRASVGVKGSALLSGSVRVRKLDLIGPRIVMRRKADGTLEVGFRMTTGGKKRSRGEKTEGEDVENLFRLDNVFKIIDEQIFSPSDSGRTTLSSLEAVHITRASISFYDELNDVLWFAPSADLVFRRVPYGFALFVAGDVSNGGRPWRTELTATFRRKSRTFTVAARVFDVIPAEFARNIFALSRLAQMNLPLSGHVEAEFSSDGRMLKASAELSAGRGTVGFPGYIAKPVSVQEGLIRVDYEPESGDFMISPSVILINGGAAELRGRISPVRNEQGRVRALGLTLELSRGDLGRPRRKGELIIDHLTFRGTARIDAARLDVEDFQLRSGQSRVHMRGRFVGEETGVGIYLGGRVTNLTAGLIKKLWPPVLAPNARRWIRENVHKGIISEGTFRLGIPGANMIAAIKRHEVIPDEQVDVRFKVGSMTFSYFRNMTPITDAAGQARLTGNHFELTLNRGRSILPSGRILKLQSGRMRMRDLAPIVSPTEIEVDATGRAEAFLELLDEEPLQLISTAGMNRKQLKGEARVRVTFSMPVSRHMKASDIVTSAVADLENVTVSDIMDGMDLEDGKLRVAYAKGRFSASGRMRVAGVPARIQWSRALKPGSVGNLSISATLTGKQRRKLGLDLSPWFSGPIPLTLKAKVRDGRISSAKVRADLSRVSMRIDPLKWSRAPVKGTRASFAVEFGKKGDMKIRRLSVQGGKLRVNGELVLNENGSLREATFSRFELDSLNRLALGIKRSKGRLDIAAAGDAFDARPFVKSFFSESGHVRQDDGGGKKKRKGSRRDFVKVTVNLKRVLMERGENVFDVRGFLEVLDGVVTRAALTGRMASGQPVTLDIVPAAAGQRRLRIVSKDAGAVLRASGLYSKIFGGRMEFSALLARPEEGGVRRGLLVIRRFAVRNEGKLATIERNGRRDRKQGGPRRGFRFKKLVLPFSTDRNFIRIGNALVKGVEIGATANGLIRKVDGAMDIGGTIIPAYGVNAAIGQVPLLGELLTGGRGQGVFGMTYALRGTLKRPKFIVNPLSAIAPGVLRGFFEVGGNNVSPDGTQLRRIRKPEKRSRSNIVNGG